MKGRRSFYNIIFGIGGQILTIALGIVIPRLFISTLGSEVNGLMSSITQIVVYLGLLEAGVGGASIQALYSPISKGDKDGVNGILAATSQYYRKTGIWYCVAVVLCAIIYPLFITSNISRISIFAVIFLTGMSGAINFFFQGKFKLLLTAEGKSYVVTIVATIINLLTSAAKIALLLLGYNIVLIQLSYFIISILQMIIMWFYIKRNYKWINLSVKANYDAISQKNSVLVHQVSGLIFNNTDVLVLTVFCGLKVVSVYVIYNMLFEIVNTAISNINSGIVFVLGQSYYEDKNKYMKLYDSYELYYMAMVFALYAISYVLILPFMKLYTAGITDINYIKFWLPVLFVILKLLLCARTPSMNAINVSGRFRETQYRSVFESTINIVASLIFVKYYGIYGVLMGTIVALLYRTNDIILYSNKHILKRSPWITYKRWLINVTVFLAIIYITTNLHIFPTTYINIVGIAIVLAITIIPIFFIIGSIFEMRVCKYTLSYVTKYIGKGVNNKKR
ncbi:lipopolysaccharide biosynthesis protein [Clostridium psychrophilum]|uniref:lipopolysaccharide biosynthesis protein n=1 Tax=Clostridium psychrophilum TaxID=132926 RepID=UPI001C0B71A8|nr:sugar isomerase [Clostridium psychrophilum]MBU3180714.1 sugar isomerase [Clostridium psychrophilum]